MSDNSQITITQNYRLTLLLSIVLENVGEIIECGTYTSSRGEFD